MSRITKDEAFGAPGGGRATGGATGGASAEHAAVEPGFTPADRYVAFMRLDRHGRLHHYALLVARGATAAGIYAALAEWLRTRAPAGIADVIADWALAAAPAAGLALRVAASPADALAAKTVYVWAREPGPWAAGDAAPDYVLFKLTDFPGVGGLAWLEQNAVPALAAQEAAGGTKFTVFAPLRDGSGYTPLPNFPSPRARGSPAI